MIPAMKPYETWKKIKLITSGHLLVLELLMVFFFFFYFTYISQIFCML